MGGKDWIFLMVVVVIVDGIDALTKQQLKKSSQMFKKKCMAKIDVTEGIYTLLNAFTASTAKLVGDIDKGKFIEDKNVMCYIACIYQMAQVVKNNKLSYEASIKQVDLMYPAEMKDAVKKSVENCKDVSKKYKDLCEASFWTAKCIYEDDPKNFVFA